MSEKLKDGQVVVTINGMWKIIDNKAEAHGYSSDELAILRFEEGVMLAEYPDGRSYRVTGIIADNLVDEKGIIKGWHSEYYGKSRADLGNYVTFEKMRSVVDPILIARAEEAENLARKLRSMAENETEMPRWESEAAPQRETRHYPLGTRLVPYACNPFDRTRSHERLDGCPSKWTEEMIANIANNYGVRIVGYGESDNAYQSLLVAHADHTRSWLSDHEIDHCKRGYGWATVEELSKLTKEARTKKKAELEVELRRISENIARLQEP